jgi:hypothetical protein
VGGAAPVQAQVFTPTFMAPRVSNDIGVYYADLGDFALEGIVRGNFGGSNLGLRLGVADFDTDDTVISLGGELRSPINAGTAPVDLAFIAGVQALVGDGSSVGIQGGISLGHTFVSPGLTVTPYLAPRLALSDANPDDEFEADFLADLGIDLAFAPNLTVRFGAQLADGPQADWGLGVSWRR